MSSASLLEQWTSNVSPFMLAIVSLAIIALLLVSTVACRILFSPSKSKPASTKQSSNKDRKVKEPPTTKKPQVETNGANKKKNNKAKKNVAPVSSTSSPNSQSDESENEKAVLITTTKNVTTPAKKTGAVDDKNKSNISTTKTASVRTDNSAAGPTEDIKQKPLKNNVAPAPTNATVVSNKQKQPTKRDGTTIKANITNAKKNESVAPNAEPKRNSTPGGEAEHDQEDEGQWLTPSSKQVNQRNRNKGKAETNEITNSTSVNPAAAPEPKSVLLNSNNNVELNSEPMIPSKNSTSTIENQEPIEIFQLSPINENHYTSNDDWWKQALNRKPTFSIDDIGEWPEYDQNEQYVVSVKRIMPTRKTTSAEV